MSEYKRLTYRYEHNPQWVGTIDRSNGTESENSQCVQRLCELEDEIENGTLVRLPCRFGDTVYKIDTEISRILVGEVEKIYYDLEVGYKSYYMTADCGNRDKNLPYDKQVFGFIFNPDTDWNVTVFATQEEAEAKLRELKGEQ